MPRLSGLAAMVGSALLAVCGSGCVSFPDMDTPTPPLPDVWGSHPSVHHDEAEMTMYPLRSSAVKMEVDREFSVRHPGFGGWFFSWCKDRVLDLQDIVSADLAAGRGFVVNLRPTEYLQVGLGWFDGAKVGWRARASGWWDDDRIERGVSVFYWMEIERQPRWGTRSLFAHDYDYTGWDIWEERTKRAEHDPFDFGGSLIIAFVGVDVNLSPYEFVDAILGWDPCSFIQNCLGYHAPNFDIAADDTWSQLKDELVRERGIEEK